MRLVIQIPCFNEADHLLSTLRDLPTQIDGTGEILIVVVDDGSVDATAQVAYNFGVSRVIRHRNNSGLAQAFTSGLDASLKLGADLIVNTDADGQYPGREIERLIAPILVGQADLVIGDRRPNFNIEFTWLKRRP